MKAGSGPLGAAKVHQLRKVANERKNEVPLIEDDEIRDFLREGTQLKKAIIEKMRTHAESSIEEKVEMGDTSDPSFEEEDTKEDIEVRIKRQAELVKYQRAQQIAYLKLQEKT